MKTTERLLNYVKSLSAAGRSDFAKKADTGNAPAGAAKELGVDVEISRQRGPGGFQEFLNPDDLVAKKGLDIYDRMMTDTQVRMAINYKRFAVISADWDIVPASKSDRDAEIAQFARQALENMRGSVVQAAFGIMNALVHGYSISEMVFEPISCGRFEGKWGLRAIKPKHPEDYDFEIDRFGNITGLWLTDENGSRSKLPMWKFVLYTYLPEYDRPWGRSDLRSVYKHWWSKDFLLKWWNIYLETFGAPTRVGKYPSGATSVSKQEDLKRILKDIVNNTAITLPDDMNIEFVTAAGNAGFESAIDYHDSQIVKGILGQTLTTGEGQRVGSMALGSIHQDTMEDYVTFLRRDLSESVLQEQVIRRLVDFNYSSVSEYPKFVWQPRKEKIALATVSDIASLIDAKIVTEKDFDYLRDRLDLPPVQPAGVSEAAS